MTQKSIEILIIDVLTCGRRSMFANPDPVDKELLVLMDMSCSRSKQQSPIAKPEQWNSRNRSRVQFLGVMLEKIKRHGRHSSSLSPTRALLIGVSYNDNKNYRLKGTVNDVKYMTDVLIDNFGYKAENIRILTEEEHKTSDLIPTKTNIQKQMRWLVDGSKPGDSLVFYYSGHGVRLPDFDGEESDGFDESICPVDFMKEGMILDDEIYATIVTTLIKGVTLHAIIDACNSGTILDLQYVYNTNEKKWRESENKRKHNPDGGLAISISACQDNQVAADTDAFSHERKVNGAMTYILQDIVKSKKDLTYEKLLDLMNKSIAEANQQGCLPARFVRKVFKHNWFLQTPQLSASDPFDVARQRFQL